MQDSNATAPTRYEVIAHNLTGGSCHYGTYDTYHAAWMAVLEAKASGWADLIKVCGCDRQIVGSVSS